MLAIAWRSLRNRWGTVLLATLAMAMSVALILTVEKIRREARTSFAQTVSGTDLIVGARSGSIQLLLYSVFRIGNATSNITWESAEEISARPAVKWTIPISLGDSHRGYRVVGTTEAMFTHYRYSRDRALRFSEGAVFDDVFDAVVGSEVARALNYVVGDEIIIGHGTGSVSLVEHDQRPFRISGILAPTGTPVDRSVHVSLAGIEAVHVDWQSGASAEDSLTMDEVRQMELIPGSITAMLVGLKSRGRVFREQRSINTYRQEPLQAILPAVALQELWNLIGVAEKALFFISISVVLAGLVNLVSVLLASLGERRREMAILRASGARPLHVFSLLCIESTVLTIIGLLAGLLLHYLIITVAGLWISDRYGLIINVGLPGTQELWMLFSVLVAGIVAGLIPAIAAYRSSLADGMTQRL